ncbi:MAG: barstar family protein [Oscillospiraceae bacterium]|nr:barstar family protein [Oscillospiraceae bacterium]
MEYRIDCAAIGTRPQLHEALARTLDFPEWYGHNLDALYDQLTAISGETRLILEHWDTFATLGRGFRRVLEDAAEKNPNFQVMFL